MAEVESQEHENFASSSIDVASKSLQLQLSFEACDF